MASFRNNWLVLRCSPLPRKLSQNNPNRDQNYNMLNLGNVIHNYERTLRVLDNMPLSCNSFRWTQPRGPEDSHIDLEISQAVQELGRLKAEYIDLRTKEVFTKTILTAKSLDDLPTSQEIARTEMGLQEEKRRLREIKGERVEAEKQLVGVIAEVGNALRDEKIVRDEAYLRLRQARTALKALDVEEILERGDVAQLEFLVEDIDELDGGTCRKIIKTLQKERKVMEGSVKGRSEVVEHLRVEVDELETDVSNLTVQASQLKHRIAKGDERNPKVPKLRQELMMQQKVGSVLNALTGIRVSEVYANSASVQLNVWCFVPFRPNVDRSRCTHTLHVELRQDENEEAFVSRMVVEPAAISVADLCKKGGGVGFTEGVQMVCARLAEYFSV